jgi:hypothetical protein
MSGADWVIQVTQRPNDCRGPSLPLGVGPVTANVCKMAIGHEGQIYQQLARCCAVLCSGQLSYLLTLRRPALWGRKAAKPDFAEGQGRHF